MIYILHILHTITMTLQIARAFDISVRNIDLITDVVAPDAISTIYSWPPKDLTSFPCLPSSSNSLNRLLIRVFHSCMMRSTHHNQLYDAHPTFIIVACNTSWSIGSPPTILVFLTNVPSNVSNPRLTSHILLHWVCSTLSFTPRRTSHINTRNVLPSQTRRAMQMGMAARPKMDCANLVRVGRDCFIARYGGGIR